MAHLSLSPQSKRDLMEIGLYIARQSGSRKRADNFVDSIYQTCDMLATNPQMGQLRPEFASGQYRSFSVGNYVIYYSGIPDGIRVARILHGARDHGSLL
jgi:toxin ParE1/3/4